MHAGRDPPGIWRRPRPLCGRGPLACQSATSWRTPAGLFGERELAAAGLAEVVRGRAAFVAATRSRAGAQLKLAGGRHDRDLHLAASVYSLIERPQPAGGADPAQAPSTSIPRACTRPCLVIRPDWPGGFRIGAPAGVHLEIGHQLLGAAKDRAHEPRREVPPERRKEDPSNRGHGWIPTASHRTQPIYEAATAPSMADRCRVSGRQRAVVRAPDFYRRTPGSCAAEPGVGFAVGGDYPEHLDRESVSGCAALEQA